MSFRILKEKKMTNVLHTIHSSVTPGGHLTFLYEGVPTTKKFSLLQNFPLVMNCGYYANNYHN